MHQFKAEQYLPISLEEAWDFFSSPKNLSKITPKDMDFKILTKLDDKPIYVGMQIDYIVRPLFGIPMPWKTEISKVDYLKSFTDNQLKGPYSVWEHTHTFQKLEHGVLMYDVVNYKVPFGLLGKLVNKLLIQKKVQNIFKYREKVLNQIFNQNGKVIV